MSQASAELRPEDADTKAPGKSSSMLTRHAKVRGRKAADLGPTAHEVWPRARRPEGTE